MKTVDAKGLACPQPIMKMVSEMKNKKNKELEIIVDNATAKENVIRTAQGKNWRIIEISTQDELFSIKIKQ